MSTGLAGLLFVRNFAAEALTAPRLIPWSASCIE